jgi:transcription antitermination factor NusG
MTLSSRHNLHSRPEDLPLSETGNWHAIYTRHQHEHAVANVLSLKGFEIFLPLYRSIRQWKDRRKELELPLLPCYVFVRGSLNRRFDIMNLPGVNSFVCSGSEIAIIADAELDPIRRAVASRLPVEPCLPLQCGDWVRVRTGPLAGIQGSLLRKKDRLRLVLSVDLLHRGVAVEVDEASVEHVDTFTVDEAGTTALRFAA